MKTTILIPAILLTLAASGCATWDGMSSRQKRATTGAAVGGVAGAHGRPRPTWPRQP